MCEKRDVRNFDSLSTCVYTLFKVSMYASTVLAAVGIVPS